MTDRSAHAKQTAIALLRTASVVRRQYEALMNRHGITLQQFNVLRILRGAGSPLPTMTIADRMIEPEPGITRLIGRLEAKGLVERHRCSEDSRRMLCEITEQGLSTLRELDKPVIEMDVSLFPGLPETDLARLRTLLEQSS